MREIKFRGKTKTGFWKYGCLMYSDNISPAIHWEVGSGAVKSFNFCYVIPETVGQYTGLKDKNGKEIYEGDICLTDDNDHIQIEYRENKQEYSDTNIGFTTYGYTSEYLEVTGNIHD